jgi:hypothetical protein
MDNYDEMICVVDKEDEMLEFINRYIQKNINRIGDDIIRIMPCRGILLE